ncbi:hypothetical protein OC846_005662 [Tilletia horrida]|uniref:Nuclear protein DGCR14 n=1 Tax=Tilletia horrida TaxID=155126 RepID=A0AAN6GQ49_9BASI|nr:hypothetical protein OC845_005831 [Tilletia horrida]KAK0545452.1 hypothetical protein OC846_005662 [Tilletia horrida]
MTSTVAGGGGGVGRDLQVAERGPSDAGGVSLRSQHVLTEQDYIESVSSIIQRDFFPDLDRLKAENEYLDALQSGDEDWIEASVRKLVKAERRAAASTPSASTRRTATARGTPAPTPRRLDLTQRGWDNDHTPLHQRNEGPSATPYSRYPHTRSTLAGGPSQYAPSEAGDSSAPGSSQPDTSMSLSAFQRTYTSEDNASFSRLLQLNSMRRRERYAWAYKAEEAANQKRIKAEERQQSEAQHGRKLAIAAAIEADPDFQKKIKGKERLLIEAAPSEADLEQKRAELDKDDPDFDPKAALKPIQDKRPATFPSWRFTARNAFLFGPDANINTYDRSTSSLPSASASSAAKSRRKDVRSVKADQPGIRFNALRMPDVEGVDGALRREGGLDREPDSPSSSRIDAAIAGKQRASTDAASSTAGDGTLDDLSDVSANFATPRVNGYGFVTPLAHTPRDESVLGDYLDSIGADDAMRRSLGLEVFDEEGEARVLELKRWGRENVPVRAGGASKSQEDEYDGSFRVPPTPRRDQIGRKLAQATSSSATNKTSANATPYGQVRYTGGFHGSSARSSKPSSSSSSRSSIYGGGSTTPRSSGAHLSVAGQLLLQRTSKSGLGKTPARLGDTLLRKRTATAARQQDAPSFGDGDEKRRRRAEIGVREREAEEAVRVDRLRRTRWTPAPE